MIKQKALAVKRIRIVLVISILLISVLLTSTSCRRDLNYIIGNKPNFRGIVVEIAEDSVTVRITISDDDALHKYSHVRVPLPPTYSDGDPGRLQQGDEVSVYYESILPTEDEQLADLQNVYAVFLVTPAGREIDVSRIFGVR
ncbi:MAG: hypothetical protein IJW40_03795 [Clostridia bacterium]|nr:hypothetical protein [Clostridia bacterium]